MSHWFTAVINEMEDMDLIEKAAEFLEIAVEHDAIARGFSSKKAHGDLVLRIPEGFDVAINKRDDKVTLVTDWFGGGTAAVVGKDYEYLRDAYGAQKVKKLANRAGKSAVIKHRAEALGGLEVTIGV